MTIADNKSDAESHQPTIQYRTVQQGRSGGGIIGIKMLFPTANHSLGSGTRTRDCADF